MTMCGGGRKPDKTRYGFMKEYCSQKTTSDNRLLFPNRLNIFM